MSNSFFHTNIVEEGVIDISLNPDHAIFKAHFPNYPILPGSCICDILRSAMEKAMDKKLTTKEVKQLKFLQPIDPHEHANLRLCYSILEESETIRMKGTINAKEKTLCKADILLRIA